MRVERLRRMGMGEFVTRGRQEASKWLERALLSKGRGLAAARQALALPVGRLFAGTEDAGTPDALARRMPAARATLLASADRLLEGRFDLLGYRDLRFGDPIDWHRDPVSGRRAPLVHWSRVRPLDAGQVGDSKVIWELGRHQWLVTLAQAYRVTGDERYADAVSRNVLAWLNSSPRGMGIHWASSLECALRILSWAWLLPLLRGARVLEAGLRGALVAALEDHATHVERYLSTYFSPNTHLTGEALGLVYAGLLLGERPAAWRWRSVGAGLLVEQSAQQILADGVYVEQATAYHRYTAEIYLHFLILARRNRMAVPDAVVDRVVRLLDALLALRRPDGALPSVGDADGGWLLPLTTRSPGDVRGVFAVAAAVFGRPDYAWAAGGPAPEVLWLLGTEGLAAFDALDPAPPPRPPSALLREGGYAVLASGWDASAHQLVFDVGPLGCPTSGAHGHADLLGLQCNAFGEPFVVDPGTGVYVTEGPWRDYFRGTSAHATVLLDGRGQADPAGPFAWSSRPEARVRHWLSTGAFDLVDADHDAYRRLPDPVVHRRRVLFVKPRYWVVADDLSGSAVHSVEVRFPFAPLEVSLDPDPWVRARGRRGGLLLRVFAGVAVCVEVRRGQADPPDGWISPDYGRWEPAPVAVHGMRGRLPLRLLTLILPIADADGPPPVVTARAGPHGPKGLVVGDEVVTFEERTFSLGRR